MPLIFLGSTSYFELWIILQELLASLKTLKQTQLRWNTDSNQVLLTFTLEALSALLHPQRRWMVCGAAGGRGAAVEPPWRDIGRGGAITPPLSKEDSPAVAQTDRRRPVTSPSSQSTVFILYFSIRKSSVNLISSLLLPWHMDMRIHCCSCTTADCLFWLFRITGRSDLCLSFRQETCDNDDDFTIGWRDELPPGVQGCLRPKSPENSFLRVKPDTQAEMRQIMTCALYRRSYLHYIILWQKAKQYYTFGEDEEFECVTGFDLDGFQYINCLPDGSWSQISGRCISKSVFPLNQSTVILVVCYNSP